MSAPDPVAFTIFGQDIRWYGILIALGFVIGILMAYKRAPEYGIKSDTLLDFAIWLMPISVIGARAYYVIFSWADYVGDRSRLLYGEEGEYTGSAGSDIP